MQVYYEKRNGFRVSCYIVDIDTDMKKRAMDFATEIIRTDNQYSRLLPTMVRKANNPNLQYNIEIQRTYLGKLGEMSFLKFLQEKGKEINVEGMFDVYEGQENVDSFDFITSTGETVDVKTGFRRIHTRLVINIEQFEGEYKDYYVGVKINANDIDEKQKLVDLNNIATANILGYAEYSYLKKYAHVRDFGEGPAKFLPYNHLLGIDRLLTKF